MAAVLGTGAQKPSDRIEFPIFNDQARYQQHAPRKIAGIPAPAASVIESAQPYQRGVAFAEHPLWRLHELATIDKHRRLHIGHVSLEAVTISVGATVSARSGERHLPRCAPSKGCCWPGSRSQRSIGSEGRVISRSSLARFLTVAFEDSGTVTGEGVIGTLRGIRDSVADVLDHLEPYIGIV